jgi:hypothetical protein
MSKVKDLDLSVVAEEPEQTIEDFLAVMDANERGYFVNVIQPNSVALDIINGLKDFIYKPSLATGFDGGYDETVVKAATTAILKAIKSIKLEP